MELKCKQSFLNIVEYSEDSIKFESGDDNYSSYDDDDGDDVNDDDILPPITYRSIGIQTESPFMVDKAIQVFIPRVKSTRAESNLMFNMSTLSKPPINGHGLMPNIVYGKTDSFYESLSNEIDLGYNQALDEDVSINKHSDHRKLIGSAKRKQKMPNDGASVNKSNKIYVGDESYKHHDSDSNDLTIGFISYNDGDPIDMEADDEQTMSMVNRTNDSAEDALELDDLNIFTHHPTGLAYQIFNEKRSINKEMMEQVFASVIGREDKFYFCLYPPHNGSCHSNTGKSTKIRVVKNHLTSHLFLYRCRLCGRTYKYYNNLFNHFNKHP